MAIYDSVCPPEHGICVKQCETVPKSSVGQLLCKDFGVFPLFPDIIRDDEYECYCKNIYFKLTLELYETGGVLKWLAFPNCHDENFFFYSNVYF